jgi:protein TonB
MRKLLILIFTTLSSVVFSQTDLNVEDNTVYSSAGLEFQPEFPGGSNAFAEYISKSFKLPNVKGLHGKVIVEFVVEKDGHLDDIKIIRDIGWGTGQETVRVLKESPIWKPGMQNGKLIRVRYSLPINIDVKG